MIYEIGTWDQSIHTEYTRVISADCGFCQGHISHRVKNMTIIYFVVQRAKYFPPRNWTPDPCVSGRKFLFFWIKRPFPVQIWKSGKTDVIDKITLYDLLFLKK